MNITLIFRISTHTTTRKVLNDVYQYHRPPVRRLPPLLWTRVKSRLCDYITERDSGGVNVICWYHKQFVEAAEERLVGWGVVRFGVGWLVYGGVWVGWLVGGCWGWLVGGCWGWLVGWGCWVWKLFESEVS